jgi:hypothetical protein
MAILFLNNYYLIYMRHTPRHVSPLVLLLVDSYGATYNSTTLGYGHTIGRARNSYHMLHCVFVQPRNIRFR